MIILDLVKFVLSPFLILLEGVNFGINFLIGIDFVVDILNVVAFVLPWDNILILLEIIISLFVFRAILSLIRLIWSFIPIIGN